MEVLAVNFEGARAVGGDAPASSRKVRRGAFYASNLVADLITITLAFTLPAILGLPTPADPIHAPMLLAFGALYAGFVSRSINGRVIADWRAGIGPAIVALCTAATIVLTLAFVLKSSASISRVYAGVGFLLCCFGLVAARAGVAKLSRFYFDGPAFGCLLIVDGCEVPALPGITRRTAEQLGATGSLSHPLILDQLSRYLSGFDRVLIASADEKRSAWTVALRASSVRADMLMPELDRFGALGCERYENIPLVAISAGRIPVRDDVFKRVFDLLAAIGALIFFAPLMLLTALAIKLESPGPVFFSQDRVGRGNRIFRVLKFRSMYHAACDDSGDVSTARNDRRITRIGRFIRATSIDELPQLFNVLMGDMSIVGPRPHALGSLAGDQLFWDIDPTYHHRHVSRPGLTGLAQVRGYRGATEKREDLLNRLAADLEYVHGWSIWRDIEIIFATLRVIVHRNAF